MQDFPENAALLASVEAFLKEEVMPQLDSAAGFRTRVSANILGMMRRHLEQASEESSHDERELLNQLTGTEGTLRDQTTELCRLIADDALTSSNPQLREYLWLTTLAKLAVDQPKYSGYLRALDDWAGFN